MRRSKPKVLLASEAAVTVIIARRMLARQFRVQPPVRRLAELDGAIARHCPDVLLVDLMWGNACAIELLPDICSRYPELRVGVFASDQALPFLGGAAFRSGGVSEQKSTMDGGRSAGVHILAAPIDSIEFERRTQWLMQALGCTRAECRTMLLLSTGSGVKQVARSLGRSDETVAGHLRSIHRKVRPLGILNLAAIGRVVGESLAQLPQEWEPSGHSMRE